MSGSLRCLDPSGPGFEGVVATVRRARVETRPLCAYVYDPSAAVLRARQLRAALPSGWSVFYAVKANGHREILAALAGELDGFEVSSLGEMCRANAAAPGKAVILSGPAKSDALLSEAAGGGPELINVESAHELRRLSLIASQQDVTVPVALRVNRRAVPQLGTLAMAGPATQFGIDEEAVDDVAALASRLPGVDLLGFHHHGFSNNLDAQAQARHVADALHWSVEVARRLRLDLRVVDVGGGIGVDYATGTSPFDLDAFGDALAQIRVAVDVRVVVEPGRYLVADAGWYAAEVVDVKASHGRTVAVVRGGSHHFRLPSAWRHNHPFAVVAVDDWPLPLPRPEATGTSVDLVGELCTPTDVFARDTFVGRLRAGDIVVLPLAGAYGWELSHHDFIDHPHPVFLTSQT